MAEGKPLPEFDGLFAALGTDGFPCTGPAPGGPGGIREVFASFPAPAGPDATKVDLSSTTVPGRGGRSVRVLTLTPKQPNGNALFWVHGGGHVMGVPEMDLPFHNFLSENGVTVVAPDYALGPEYPHPAAMEDVEDTFAWWTAQAESKGVKKTVLGGQSAGSTLAGIVSINLAGRGTKIPLTILDSPYVSPDVSKDASATGPATKWHIWNTRNIAEAGVHYPVADLSTLFPAHVADEKLKKLGPHLVSYPDLDVFHDQAERYGERLKSLGVQTTTREWKGRIHGFLSFGAGGPSAQECNQYYLDAINAA